jgi:hypothetical protein
MSLNKNSCKQGLCTDKYLKSDEISKEFDELCSFLTKECIDKHKQDVGTSKDYEFPVHDLDWDDSCISDVSDRSIESIQEPVMDSRLRSETRKPLKMVSEDECRELSPVARHCNVNEFLQYAQWHGDDDPDWQVCIDNIDKMCNCDPDIKFKDDNVYIAHMLSVHDLELVLNEDGDDFDIVVG